MANLEVSVFTSNGKPTVSSQQLAEHFGIKHQHVLRDIRSILTKVPASWHESNFGFMQETIVTHNNGTRQIPVYHLTRDAFTLLAMGYNSARAILWKLKYIEAFNALEQKALAAAGAEVAARMLAMTPLQVERIGKIAGYRQRGFTVVEMAKVMGVHRRTVQRLMGMARNVGVLPAGR